MEAMKIAVMGAGAVGCFYGGMLARAGHEVVLIGRPSHVESIQNKACCLKPWRYPPNVSRHLPVPTRHWYTMQHWCCVA